MLYLKFLTVLEITVLLMLQQTQAQFKILGITSGRSNNGDVALVQIKPLQPNVSEPVQSRSFGDEPIMMVESSMTPNTTVRIISMPTEAPVESQTSKIIKLQIMDSLPARNISTREGKLQNSGNHRTDNDIINIAPLQRPTIATSTLASPTSSHRRRATGSVKLTGDSEMFFIHKPSSPAPFKKQHQSKENDVIADYVIQRYKRRKYKSKCRCERIWNCPRIQISIARCAPDYFMCCF
ncbi:uncharacterized protein LOC120421358 [Culex pipiens pallens]|nr:uncharacterized protein LOC120421358 [Culex pipiens pallens]